MKKVGFVGVEKFLSRTIVFHGITVASHTSTFRTLVNKEQRTVNN